MTESQQKGSIWTKIHIDPTFLLLILALLVYSAFVMWSASGQVDYNWAREHHSLWVEDEVAKAHETVRPGGPAPRAAGAD